MKTAAVLLAINVMLCGCQTGITEGNAQKASKPDESEILIRHLLRRNNDLTREISSMERECLEGQISGKRIASDPTVALDRMVQNLLDGEDAIEEHNREHPESPQADIRDVIRQMCGDCAQERVARDRQLKEEAQKPSSVK